MLEGERNSFRHSEKRERTYGISHCFTHEIAKFAVVVAVDDPSVRRRVYECAHFGAELFVRGLLPSWEPKGGVQMQGGQAEHFPEPSGQRGLCTLSSGMRSVSVYQYKLAFPAPEHDE
jgi:hypothetical protein